MVLVLVLNWIAKGSIYFLYCLRTRAEQFQKKLCETRYLVCRDVTPAGSTSLMHVDVGVGRGNSWKKVGTSMSKNINLDYIYIMNKTFLLK